jgi:hypothetical protein
MTTELDTEIAALRARRGSPGIQGWLRTLRPFDRRSIREPSERDAYWANVQARLAVSDAASLHATRATEPPNPTTEPLFRTGDRLIA